MSSKKINAPGVSAEDWTQMSMGLGYPNEEEMLRDLYIQQHMSIAQIAYALGYAYGNVYRRLCTLRIPMRPRGGANNNKRILECVSNTQLFNNPPALLAEEFAVHISTVFKEKYLRLKESKDKEQKSAVLSAMPDKVASEAERVQLKEGLASGSTYDSSATPKRSDLPEELSGSEGDGGSDNS